MEEDIHNNDDKETLRKRLKLLKQEYEMTALRLQKAEHRDAIRRQSSVSHQNRLTHNDSSQCSTSVLASEHYDIQTSQQIQTNTVAKTNSSVFSTVETIPAIEFQLAEIASASPASMRTPAHRLRTKRSRLRLQNKERESDTDNSQEIESLLQRKSGSTEEKTKMKKESSIEMLPCDVEKKKMKEKTEKIAKKPLNQTEVKCDFKSSMIQSSPEVCPKQLPPVGRSMKKLQTNTALYLDPIQTSSLPTSSESLSTYKSEGIFPPASNTETKHSSVMSGALDSCTLVEGLPFPVEYYIRTTRRMAASQSSVNLEAVIQSQLTGGRGRRKLSQSQMRGRSQVTTALSESVCRPTDQAKRKGKGQRRRGRRRTTIVRRRSCSKADSDCTISQPASESQAECLVLIDSKPTCQAESTAQSKLEKSPQAGSQPIPSPECAVNMNPSKEEGVTQDFKHLPDSQLYFESNLFPIFRRGHGQTGRSSSQSQTCMSKVDQSPLLPSLSALIQALQEKDTKIGLLASVDIQDFHLPDEDFGQLKLERLRLSTSLMEPFVQRVYQTRRSNRRQTASSGTSNSEVLSEELFNPEPPTSCILEDSVPLCPSDPVGQSRTEKQNTDQSEKHIDPVNKLNSRSSDRMDSGQEQTWTEKTAQEAFIVSDKNIVKIQTSGNENVCLDPEVGPQICKQTDSHTLSENSPLCPVLLDLSLSLTSHTPRGQDSALPSLGMTPHFFSPGSPTDLQPHLLSPPDSHRSPSLNMPAGCVSPDLVTSKTFGNIKANTSTKSSDPTKVEEDTETQHQNNAQSPPQNNIAIGHENLSSTETEMQALCIMGNAQKCSFDTENNAEFISKTDCTREIEAQCQNLSESAAQLISDIQKTQNDPKTEVQTCKDTELRAATQKDMVMNQSQCVDVSVCAGHNEVTSVETSTNQKTEDKLVCTTNADSPITKTLLNEEPVPSTIFSNAGHCSSMLREVHTFKALEGCVLDLCLVRWTVDDWCICVAGEWSVCLWTCNKEIQQWSLIHTWTFAQSVISLQAIPDSSGLLCVTLGHLEITEARVLCCPSSDGPFTQIVVCKDALQAVVGLSNCRLVCCSTPGDQQKVTVITFTKEGRVLNTLLLVLAKQNTRTLAVVEGINDALIGWTECKTLLIWNIKTGHLLQTINLEKSLPTINCMKGYSYRGVLCALLQNAGNVCEEKSDTTLFTLIAMNPLTGKHITLTSISNPAEHVQQLIDGDVFGSGLVGVFQSGHIAVWDLKGRVAKVVGVLDELCRLARWAGQDTLLTGYLNGDVSVFQYKTV